MESRSSALVASALIFFCSLFCTDANLIVLKADRKVDLSSHNVRAITSLKFENGGSSPVSEVLFALSSDEAKSLAFIGASSYEGKAKNKVPINLTVKLAEQEGAREGAMLFVVVLDKHLKPGESTLVDVYMVTTQVLKPFPAEITQADSQLVLFSDSAHVVSPYPIKVQTSSFKLPPPNPRIESYTRVNPVKLVDGELKYGPYENIPPFSSLPITVHYEMNQPFAVVEELVREIEISNWGNIYVTENYHLVHGGARHKGGFSRLDFQARPGASGRAALRGLVARLPPRAHSVYYRDEIGNVSTSHLRFDKEKTELQIEPRYPLLGGWRVTFTIGYGVPLQDFVSRAADGGRYLRFPFGCPLQDVFVKNLIVKVVLPEGSKQPLAQVPFGVQQSQEVKYSYLDSVGRPVLVLTKRNVVQEHNVFFEVHFKFNTLGMLVEPMMLVAGFLLFFVACIAYSRFDFSISKSSASYQARLQREELIDAVQRLQKIFNFRHSSVSDKLEWSLKELARTGDVSSCKATRKTADAALKESNKDLKEVLDSLLSARSASSSSNVLPKVEALMAKEKEMQEKLIQKHMVVVEAYERKLPSKEIDTRSTTHQQRISALKLEIDDLMQSLDDF